MASQCTITGATHSIRLKPACVQDLLTSPTCLWLQAGTSAVPCAFVDTLECLPFKFLKQRVFKYKCFIFGIERICSL